MEHELLYSNVSVSFPFNPNPTERAILGSVIKSCLSQQNLIINSPTSSGKTLSLMAGTLAYQNYVSISQSHLQNSNSVSIIFIGKDSSSITHFKNILSQIPGYNPQLGIFYSKKLLCTQQRLSQSSDINTESICSKLRHEGFCKAQFSDEIPSSLQPNGLRHHFDIEDLNNLCRGQNLCPYRTSFNLISRANIIFSSPFSAFELKSSCPTFFSNSIIVFDHIEEIIKLLLFESFFEIETSKLITFLAIFDSNINKESEIHSQFSNLILFFHKIHRWICNSLNLAKLSGRKDYSYPFSETREILKEWGCSLIEFPQLKAEFFSFRNDEKILSLLSDIKLPLIKIFQVLTIAFSKNGTQLDNFGITVSSLSEREGVMTFRCMDPSIPFGYLTELSQNTIIAGHFFSPIDFYIEELNLIDPMKLNTFPPYPNGNFQIFPISSSNNVTFLSTFESMKESKDDMFVGIAQIIFSLIPYIPDGILIFVPNFSYLKLMMTNWTENKFIPKIKKEKNIFVENEDIPIFHTYQMFKDSINNHQSSIFFTVYNSDLDYSQFKFQNVKALFAIGLPTSFLKSPALRRKKEYLDYINSLPTHRKVYQKEEWAENAGISLVLNLISRCITSENDYAAVFLIDERYSLALNLFPQWLRQSINLNMEVPIISNFFTTMSNKYQSVARLKTGVHTDFFCKGCGAQIMILPFLEDNELIEIRYPGFLQLIDCIDGEKVYFVKMGLKKNLIAHLGNIIWFESDLNGYIPLICKCGTIVGAYIKVSSDIKLLEHIWICSSRIKAQQTEEKNQKKSSPIISKSKSPFRKSKSQTPKVKEEKKKSKSNPKAQITFFSQKY